MIKIIEIVKPFLKQQKDMLHKNKRENLYEK